MIDDYMTQHIIRENPKMRATSGGLTLQGYGALKNLFATFLSTLRSKNIDLIMIAHAQEKEDGDTMRLRPKMTGGAYDMLIAKSDLVGYMEMRGNRITLDFTPTDRHIGKNCAELPLIELPHYETAEYQTYLADILIKTKNRLTQETKEQAEAVKIVKKFSKLIKASKDLVELSEVEEKVNELDTVYRVQVQKVFDEKYIEFWISDNVDTAKTVNDFNELIGLSSGLQKSYQKPVKTAIMSKATEKGFTLNLTTKQFEEAEEVEEVETEEVQKEETK